ncbi:hypothetical protein Q8W15_05980 [Photobacterium damselae subsp. piscicida]|nr:hypothetical protein [Photobacterium damselae subsp. piscicida]MDP2557014.1 hypothetical protein [Photobacterium damselae subsp. piscicida]
MEHKILVVEDSRPFRRVLEVELRKAGYTPIFAESIADAEKILDQDSRFLMCDSRLLLTRWSRR